MRAAIAERGEARLVVPPTPSGVATALTRLGTVNRRSAPWPVGVKATRRLPPIELDERADARTATSEPEVVIESPSRLDSLFVIAPLAHYLGAEVTTGSREAPRVRIPDRGLEHDLPPLPDLQDAVAELLGHVVGLDRPKVGDSGTAVRASDATETGRDGAANTTPGKRLAAYLYDPSTPKDGDAGEVDLTMYVEPSVEHVPALSYLLERPCAIYLPEATTVEREELLRRSLADFYRSYDHPEVDVDLVAPTRRRGTMRGWLADGVAVNAFKASVDAYENRRGSEDRADGRRVTVVLNDPEMQAEGTEVERIYRRRAASLGADVSIERGLGRAELAAVLDRPTSFLHYVGHCDEAGLRCVDGHLSIQEIDESGARTFLLNACGSYNQGRALVRQGSVAGAVTLGPILDEQAAKVGVAFAGLVTRGFCIERALRIARRRTIVNKDYVVVGDGTHALEEWGGSGGRIERRNDDRFRFVLEGGSDPLTVTTTRSELLSYLRRVDTPVVYEGERRPARAVFRFLAEREPGDPVI